MKKYLLLIALIFAALSTAPRAHAMLVSAGDTKFGPGSFTIDTATGLEWLDLSQTFNQSMDSIKAQFGVGATYHGLRYATADEVRTLYTDAGLYSNSSRPELFWAEYNLLGLIGYAPAPYSWEDKNSGSRAVWGITDTHVYFPERGRDGYIGTQLQAIADFPVTSDSYIRTDIELAYNCDDTTFGSAGSWIAEGSFLVRDQPCSPRSVPEPSTILLVGAGLAGIGFLRKRVKL